MNRNKMWKGFALVLALVMFLTACAGGGSSTNSTNTGSSSTGSTGSTSSGSDAATQTPEPAEPPTITVYASDFAKVTPTNQDADPTIQYMREKSGINVQMVFVANSNYTEQMQLKFASGEYPDAFQSSGINNGAAALAIEMLLPLNDLIEQYGPNLKKNIPQEAWDAVTLNGQILGIPAPSEVKSSRILFIRKDWLDKLGLDYPKTSDEYLDVLRAFRDNDLNGNGEKDEIPFSTRQGFNWVMDAIWGMWGLSPSAGFEYNGEVIPGFAHPRFKEPLRFVQTMYQEGLMDSEFLTNSSSIWAQKFESGRVGSYGYMPSAAWSFHKRMVDASPDQGINMMTMPTPRGTGWDGPVGATFSTISQSYHVMKTAKDPVAVVKFFDWLLSDEGQIFTDLGVEGLNYKIENGKIVYDEATEAEHETEWRATLKLHGHNPVTLEAKYPGEAGEKLARGLEISHSEGFDSVTLNMPPLDAELQNVLFNSWQERAAEIVVNNEPVENWDTFIEEVWRKQGGNDLIKAMTDWVNQNK